MFKFLLLFTIILVSSNIFAVGNDTFEYHGYMRAGTGNNSKGGGMTCLNNPGAIANEFRVGNECDLFSENVFVANLLKDKSGKGKFFKSHLRVTFKSAVADQDWSEVQAGSNSVLVLREAFFQGGRFDDSKFTFWAGKRFYREQDVWMNDLWYFDISGYGGGIEDIPVGFGNLNFAFLRKTDTSYQTDIGYDGVNHYDFRIRNIDLGKWGELLTWLAYEKTPESKTSSGTEYGGYDGFVAGILNRTNFKNGFNHFSLAYGSGLLESQAFWGDVTKQKNTTAFENAEDASRIRVIDQVMLKLNDHLELNMAATFELKDNGSKDKKSNNSLWYNFGITPVYSFTDHYQLLFQAGHSVIDADGDRKRTLTRFTIAPQVAVGGFWGRPVLRVFYSRTFWNTANRGQVDSSGPYQNETSGGNIGIQGEVWF